MEGVGEEVIAAVRVLVGQEVLVTGTRVERIGVEVSRGGGCVCVGNSRRIAEVGFEMGVGVAAGRDKSQMPPIVARASINKRPTPSRSKMKTSQRLRGAR